VGWRASAGSGLGARASFFGVAAVYSIMARRVLLVLVGVVGLVFPRFVLRVHARANLVGFRNVEKVEPKRWLVWVVRLAALAALVVGVQRGGEEG
jgi:hypothetical protein